VVRLVLFDIDGTLIRTGGAGVKAFELTFATEFKIARGTEKMKFAGRTDVSLVREFFTLHEIDPSPDNFARFFDRYTFWLDHVLHEATGETCEGVDEFIRDLAALPDPPTLGLLTGNIRLGAELKLRRYQLWEYFTMGAFGDDHEDRNQLAVIAKARGSRLLKEELSGEQILVIGDTPRDIECAAAIDAQMLAVATGGASLGDLETHRPTWAVKNLREITAAETCGQAGRVRRRKPRQPS